jgi:hypothetical protein
MFWKSGNIQVELSQQFVFWWEQFKRISLIDYMLSVRWWRQEAKWRNTHDECDDKKPSDVQAW